MASAAAAGSAVGDAQEVGDAADVTLHPLRQREVLRLYKEFKQQHEAGVCRVPRFGRLLRLKYPTESKAHIAAMVQVCVQHESGLDAAEKDRVAQVGGQAASGSIF